MTAPPRPAASAGPVGIRSLAFLTPGNFADDDPYTGLEDTLRLFEYGEALGYDGAWIRQRHLEHGVGSAAVFLAAAGQRTRRVELGTAVIPIGYESPFRLAEDLALADVLSRGRLQVGFSTGMPHAELLGDLVYDGDWREFDLSHGRITRLVDNLRGDYLGGPDTVIQSPGNVQRPRLQPHNPGLVSRVWYGAGSLRSARWAGETGLNLLTGNVLIGGGDEFTAGTRWHPRWGGARARPPYRWTGMCASDRRAGKHASDWRAGKHASDRRVGERAPYRWAAAPGLTGGRPGRAVGVIDATRPTRLAPGLRPGGPLSWRFARSKGWSATLSGGLPVDPPSLVVLALISSF